MSCKKPNLYYRSRSGRNPNGAWPIVPSITDGYIDLPVKVPCGKCIGCKLDYSIEWGIRSMHEANYQKSIGKQNCFLTLTFNKHHLPETGSIDVRTPQLFIKRLRKNHGNGIRYFQCGEYGSKNSRPHYHMLIFGFDFQDKVFWQNSNGIALYRSADLEKIWTYGYSSIGSLTIESAAYVSRYITKKITGDCLTDPKSKWFNHYENINKETGLVSELMPEKCSMSLKPGIGKKYYDRNKHDMYNIDGVTFTKKGIIRTAKIPRYYDKLHELLDGHGGLDMGHIKLKRIVKAKIKNQDDNTDERLIVRENIETKTAKLLIRSYEK